MTEKPIQPSATGIPPDGIHARLKTNKPVVLLHDGEEVAWIAEGGAFHCSDESRAVRVVERLMRRTLEFNCRVPPPATYIQLPPGEIRR